jgi:hypothetical protein
MALWDFLGGAADTLLDKRKRDMAAQLQKDLEEQRRNFQLTLDQKQAERQASRDERQAETDMLNRKREEERYTTERADRQAREAAQDARANEQLAITRESAAGAREDRRIAREDQKQYREGLAAKAREEQQYKEVDTLFSTFEKIDDVSAQNAAQAIYGSSAPISVKLERLRQLRARANIDNKPVSVP